MWRCAFVFFQLADLPCSVRPLPTPIHEQSRTRWSSSCLSTLPGLLSSQFNQLKSRQLGVPLCDSMPLHNPQISFVQSSTFCSLSVSRLDRWSAAASGGEFLLAAGIRTKKHEKQAHSSTQNTSAQHQMYSIFVGKTAKSVTTFCA